MGIVFCIQDTDLQKEQTSRWVKTLWAKIAISIENTFAKNSRERQIRKHDVCQEI